MASSGATCDLSSTSDTSTQDDSSLQVDKSLTECIAEMYDTKRLADVSFRCKDHVADDPNDRLHAHKLILAARSPFFNYMLYGPNSQGVTHLIVVFEYSKASMDVFLRFLYTDVASINDDTAEEVLKIAQFCKVLKLINLCSSYISEHLTVENACRILETSIAFGYEALIDHALNFIDDNAEEVLTSDGFQNISRETLEYLLKGDTLYAPETSIVKAIHWWASPRLSLLNKELTGRTIRELLGSAFYFLRMPVMEIAEFIRLERKFQFHSYEECNDIVSFMSRKLPETLSTHATRPRVARTEIKQLSLSLRLPSDKTYVCSFGQAITGFSRGSLGQPVRSPPFECKEDATISEIGIVIEIPPLVSLFPVFKHVVTEFNESPCSIPLTITIGCPQVQFQQTQKLNAKCGVMLLSLDPPIVISSSGKGKYSLTCEIGWHSKPCVFFKDSGQQVASCALHHVVISRPSNRNIAQAKGPKIDCNNNNSSSSSSNNKNESNSNKNSENDNNSSSSSNNNNESNSNKSSDNNNNNSSSNNNSSDNSNNNNTSIDNIDSNACPLIMKRIKLET